MAEKIKRTHAERDALLSKVFDSTLQTKDIEITEAGTMEITPDEGYFALKKVNLNVNVQGGGGNEDWEYYDVSSTLGQPDNADISLFAAYLSGLAKMVDYRNNVITTKKVGPILYAFTSSDYDFYSQIAINMAMTCVDSTGTRTLREAIAQNANSELAAAYSAISAFPRITKEEFYAM